MENHENGPVNTGNKKEIDESNKPNGLNDWNDRLDENLETSGHNDLSADEKAKSFSEKFGNVDDSKKA